jgi:two-component system cell cycle response regulator
MSSKKTFAVAMIGIPEHERHILNNIFKLSLYRTQTYTIASPDEPSEILIVDADDPKAIAEWRSLHGDVTKPAFPVDTGLKTRVPTVMVSKEKPSGGSSYYIRRPFVATRVLSVLDHVVSKELGFSQERVIGEEKKPTAIPVKEHRIYKALVVDDSKSVRKQIELELRLFGMQVDAAESAEKAFELLDQDDYDMIFVDVILPGIDGYQLCRSIKKDKLKKKIPVIILTNKSSPFDRVRGALAGCDTYLTKPVKQVSFQKVVQKYLSK